jgi:transcription-repair coupling factor (superfamily II helicase)
VPSSHNVILDALASTPGFRALLHELPTPGRAYRLGGVVGSATSATVAALHRARPDRILVAVLPDPRAAAAVEADLESLLGDDEARLFPQREALPYEADEPHLEIGGLRVEAVEGVFAGRTRVLVTTVRALQERIPVPERLAELRLTLEVGDAPGFQSLLGELDERGFERVPLVEEVGQYAVRGGIVDLFSFGAPDPVRVEFWGDEITSLRHFDILDQRTTGEVPITHVLPVDFRSGTHGNTTAVRSLLELLPGDALLMDLGGDGWAPLVTRAWDHAVRVHQELHAAGRRDLVPPQELLLEPDRALAALARFPRVELRAEADAGPSLGTEPPPPVERDMERLRVILREGAARGERTLLLCDNDGQAQRLEELLDTGPGIPPGAQVAVGSLDAGFLLPRAHPPLRVLTDHEIFRRSRRLRRGRRFRGAVALESLAQLAPGTTWCTWTTAWAGSGAWNRSRWGRVHRGRWPSNTPEERSFACRSIDWTWSSAGSARRRCASPQVHRIGGNAGRRSSGRPRRRSSA